MKTNKQPVTYKELEEAVAIVRKNSVPNPRFIWGHSLKEVNNKDSSERFPIEMIERIACGENAIKLYREYRELSQTELATNVGVSRQYISQIENDERKGTIKTLKKIAKVLSVELDDLVA